jgi:four helix bundle protein
VNKFDLQKRTRKFHIDVIKLCEHFPKNAAGFETAKQLIRSAGSMGANYRAACRGKSKADFIYKLEITLDEADESLYWLQVTKEAFLVDSSNLDDLIREAYELVSIFNASDVTAKKNKANKISKSPNPKSENQK